MGCNAHIGVHFPLQLSYVGFQLIIYPSSMSVVDEHSLMGCVCFLSYIPYGNPCVHFALFAGPSVSCEAAYLVLACSMCGLLGLPNNPHIEHAKTK